MGHQPRCGRYTGETGRDTSEEEMPPFPLALELLTLERGGIAEFPPNVSRRVEERAFACKIRDWGPLNITKNSPKMT